MVKKLSCTAVVLILLFGLSACDQAQESDKLTPAQILQKQTEVPERYSAVPRPVRINAHTLMIPGYYIAMEGGNHLSMYAYWPDVIPLRMNGSGGRDRRLDVIDIRLNGWYSYDQGTYSDPLKNILSRPEFGKKTLNEELGLWVYRRKMAQKTSYLYVSAREDSTSPDGKPLWFRCHTQFIADNPDSVQCQISYFIRNDVQLKIRFFTKNIADWQAIDARIRSLIESYFEE